MSNIWYASPRKSVHNRTGASCLNFPKSKRCAGISNSSLVGRVLRKLEIRLERVVLWPPGLGPGELEGATLRSARRRAKWLLLEFDNGLSLAVHFGLTGQLFHDGLQGKAMLGHPVPALDVPRPHKSTHAIFHFDDDSTLYYTDIRQFGRIHVVPSGEVPEFLGRRKLGVEPLTDDFQPAILENAASRRPRSKVKALLLDQRVVAGIGNIYADESLHRSGLHPARAVGRGHRRVIWPAATRYHRSVARRCRKRRCRGGKRQGQT